MRVIWTISTLTLKEAVRNKFLYLLFFFALLLTSFSWVIGKFTVGDELKIIKDIGIAGIHFFGVIITIFIGIGLIFREMEKRTIYLILTKPLKRYQFILGKFLGLAVTLMIVLVALAFSFYIVLFVKGESHPRYLWAFYLTYLEWLMIAGVAILFSSFSTPLLSAMLTLATFLIGHLTDSVFLLEQRIQSETANWLLTALFYVLPNLELFNIRAQMVHGLSLPQAFIAQTSLYWLLYLTVLLLLSVRIFQQKDFI